MNKKKYLLIFIIFICPTNAFAYFDPGSGSYLIQLILAFLASCYFFISNPIQFIKNFFNKNKHKDLDKISDEKSSKENTEK